MLRKMTWVEMKLFIRDPLTVAFSLALPLIILFVLAQVFGNSPNPEVYRGFGPTDFYVPAYIGLVLASIGLIGLPVHLAGYREQGVLRRFRASSVPAWSLFGAHTAVSLSVAAVSSVVLVTTAFLAYDVHSPDWVLGVVAAFVLGAVAFTALGILLGSLLPTARSAQLAGLILFFVMLMISGAGPPRELLGTVMQRIGDFLPLVHVITLIQDPWLGLGWNNGAMAVTIGITVAAALISIRFVRWE